ncbi:hypothetical protein [Shewanella sp. YIC-542]|uniref:hypothetical protein n=1 Tax=Shewanella mytili TaxID=3377111 RepID=UPI00398EEFFF
MMTPLLLLLLGLLLVYVMRHHLKARRHQPRNKSPGKQPASPKTSYHAVSIQCSGTPCAQVSALGNQRFLSHEAPRLPLATCGRNDCRCHYQHHEDRRTHGNGRRLEIGIMTELYGSNGERERRQRHGGRRHGDLHPHDWIK